MVEVPSGVHLLLRGSLNIANAITLEGKFEFTLSPDMLEVTADAKAVIGPLGQVDVTGGFRITRGGWSLRSR